MMTLNLRRSGVVALGIALSLAVALGVAYGSTGKVLVAGGAATLVAGAFAIPLSRVPSLGLVAFAVLPVEAGPDARVLRLVSPVFVVAAIWGMRAVARYGFRRVPLTGLLLAAVLVASTAQSQSRSSSAVMSLVIVVSLVLVPAAARAETFDFDFFLNTWLALAVALSLFAVFERYVLGRNPLFGWYYARANPVVVFQHWGVYRATTSLGHPLVNGAFFAVGLVIAATRWATLRRFVFLVLTGICVLGVVATESRSALVAVGVGVVVGIAVEPAATTGVSLRKLAGLAVVAVGGGIAADRVMQARAATSSAAVSASYHKSVFAQGWLLIKRGGALGFGPNRAHWAQSMYGTFRTLPLESIWLEVGVSIGVLGLLAFASVVLAHVLRLTLSRQGVALGAALAFLCAMSFFNALEGATPLIVVFGLLVAGGIAHGTSLSRPPLRDADPSLR